MTVAMRCMSAVSQVAAMPMDCGKLVAKPLRATPCSASFHQLYAGTPRRGMAAAASCIWLTFSSSVMRPTRSLARASGASAGLRYGQGEGVHELCWSDTCRSGAACCADAEFHAGMSAQIAASKIAGFVMVALYG